ncbi:hypothetical protein TrLO_g11238 [Triparma laevis f. longispina]|uniref:Uncharacterized protein n=1 Tax=Triparma laevis f. longispina TaxID=1714387 RepID=A0A9W7E957_9STRA|nr:hypothetical protein TrLO_g11238 [Triparma laevis f. longispina]
MEDSDLSPLKETLSSLVLIETNLAPLLKRQAEQKELMRRIKGGEEDGISLDLQEVAEVQTAIALAYSTIRFIHARLLGHKIDKDHEIMDSLKGCKGVMKRLRERKEGGRGKRRKIGK